MHTFLIKLNNKKHVVERTSISLPSKLMYLASEIYQVNVDSGYAISIKMRGEKHKQLSPDEVLLWTLSSEPLDVKKFLPPNVTSGW